MCSVCRRVHQSFCPRGPFSPSSLQSLLVRTMTRPVHWTSARATGPGGKRCPSCQNAQPLRVFLAGRRFRASDVFTQRTFTASGRLSRPDADTYPRGWLGVCQCGLQVAGHVERKRKTRDASLMGRDRWCDARSLSSQRPFESALRYTHSYSYQKSQTLVG